MRIAQVMLAKGFGGAERSFVDLCHALAARGHDVLAITEKRAVARDFLHVSPQLAVATVSCFGAWDRLAGLRLRRLIAAHGSALVQTHLARAALLGGRAARGLGLPSLAKTHNLVDLRYYRYLDHLVPTTREQAEYLLAHGRAAAELTRIPNFTALSAVTALRDPWPRQQPALLKSLGRCVHKKGFDLLLTAVVRLREAGHAVRVQIGGDGPERAALEAAIQANGLAATVELVGWIDDVGAFLADADIFVLPSRDEPFGIVLLEAMARGVPVVATPTSGPLEILLPDRGLVCTTIDAAALADALAATLLDPRATRARVARALQAFETEFSADVVVARYLALYRRLLGVAD